MQSDIIVRDEATTHSYVIHADSIVETKYRSIQRSTSQIVLSELISYFNQATKNLRDKRRELFQE